MKPKQAADMEIKLTKKTKIAFSWWTVKHCGGWKRWLWLYTHIDVDRAELYEITFLGFRAGILFYHYV